VQEAKIFSIVTGTKEFFHKIIHKDAGGEQEGVAWEKEANE